MIISWNLHGIYMESAWNLMEPPWNHYIKSISIFHRICMEFPQKLHQLEGTIEPSHLDIRNNRIYMKPP